ncbi:MAG: thioredoxin domain-containing protein [Cytophagales bacterium]|nr:thioredoxin domain-containing protein [Cytophagales bacterium]
MNTQHVTRTIYVLLAVIIAASVWLMVVIEQPYGIISVSFAVVSMVIFITIKRKHLRWSIVILGLGASCFCLASAVSFMLENRRRQEQFNLPTAVHFENVAFRECLQKAKRENKKLFVDFYTVWCGPCLQFSRTILTDAAVGEKMNAAFVNVKMNAERGEGVELSKKYAVNAYPTLLVIDPDGTVVEQVNKHFLPDKSTMIKIADKYVRKSAKPTPAF